MPLDLTGISNENEFYTHHYLTAVLEKDLEKPIAAWATLPEPPPESLRGLARSYEKFVIERAAATDPTERADLQQAFYSELLTALGYAVAPIAIETEDGGELPLLSQILRASGAPELWAIAAPGDMPDDEDPLAAAEDLLSRDVFGAPEPPRWVLLMTPVQTLLLDRTKWPAQRHLRFSWTEILGRREASTLRVAAALLHRTSLCPPNQVSLLDTLDENSHKHAFEVSDDLKYSAREAVERLGNEAVWYLREVRKEKVYGVISAEQLTAECLRYLYRLLFLFYVEARDEELGYSPMRSEEYRTGYSLESLRSLAETPLSTDEDLNGHFLHQSLQTLFRLVYTGRLNQLPGDKIGDYNFRIEPLQCDLFDPARTPTLESVRFRNHVLQEVIALLSLTRPKGKFRNTHRGRISYAQLGINQLGAVYEGLLSYTGFFVDQADGLYEVKPAGEKYDPLIQAYFVPKSALADYTDEEKVYDDRGRLMHHPAGTFVYRLAGRNRQKSASYYTPEVLTQCVVKYSMKELLKDKTADDILRLHICEPAMGSGAFLNEAVNQLADAYLDLKQRETGQIIPHLSFLREKQKVKAFLADNRVYGVDRNPVALELAEVSLWLNTIYEGHTIPWFGGQLANGNSLVGARRQAFSTEELAPATRSWLSSTPVRVPVGLARSAGQVWHFLLPDQGMADYSDKTIKELCPVDIQRFKTWRKGFTARLEPIDLRALERLSSAVDKLWQRHTEDLRQVRNETAHLFPVFGQEQNPEFRERGRQLSTRQRDEIFEQTITPRGGYASAYQRLKFVMDYWCALWFWPIEKSQLLPSRDEYMVELAILLEGSGTQLSPLFGAEQQALFSSGRVEQPQLRIADDLGTVDLGALRAQLPRLSLVAEIAKRHRFLHWELEFADVFCDHGGFDLLLGNPPWIKIEWNEGGVMSDVEPFFVLRELSAPVLKNLRGKTFEKFPALRDAYLDEYSEFAGLQSYLNASQNYQLLKGSQSNSYKCFVTLAWDLGTPHGIQGYVHPEGVYDDPNGGNLRAEIYRRLSFHFQFRNELPLFVGTNDHGRMVFGTSIYGVRRPTPHFVHVSNLFHPSTIDASIGHDGSGECGGIKDEAGNWNTVGHRDRLIEVDATVLDLFARLYDEPGTSALHARLPNLHSRVLLAVMQKFASYSHRLGDLAGQYESTEMWHETNAVNDRTIRRETRFPNSPQEWILSGPHITVANPLVKTPRRVCAANGHYDVIDLNTLSSNYLPRTNYVPDCDAATYSAATHRVSWGARLPVTEFYRFVNREMLSQAGERTLLGAIVPPGVGHINTCFANVFADPLRLLDYACMAISVPVDFRVKTTGMGHANKTLMDQLPLLDDKTLRSAMHVRTLLLHCLTTHYAPLWAATWNVEFRRQSWTSGDHRLSADSFSRISQVWQWNFAVRCDFERRQALLEIDVLAARAIGLSLAELCTIYRIQFPVLKQYEENTYYDQTGRIVYLAGDQAYGLSTPDWKKYKNAPAGEIVIKKVQDDTVPGGPRERLIEYVAPFDRCDREADYATAWAYFDSPPEEAV